MKFPLEKYKYFIAKKTDGTPYKVIAVSTYAGHTVRGVSKCDPRDEFSMEAGKKIAALRCNVKVGEKRAKAAAKAEREAAIALEYAKHRYLEMMKFKADAEAELTEAKADLTKALSNI